MFIIHADFEALGDVDALDWEIENSVLFFFKIQFYAFTIEIALTVEFSKEILLIRLRDINSGFISLVILVVILLLSLR